MAMIKSMIDNGPSKNKRAELNAYEEKRGKLKSKSPKIGRILIKPTKKSAKKQEKPFFSNSEIQYEKGMGSDFYKTREWRSIRWDVLVESDGCCSMCGRSKKRHNVVLHVDHILPRSKFPDLEFSKQNLQILCEDCNLGKSNKLSKYQIRQASE